MEKIYNNSSFTCLLHFAPGAKLWRAWEIEDERLTYPSWFGDNFLFYKVQLTELPQVSNKAFLWKHLVIVSAV